MQDRFKFRFWDKETQTMQKFPMIELRQRMTLDTIFNDDRVIFMQCTGIKDKYGKLIYEGDILALQQFKDDNVVHICFWCEETAEYLYEPIIKGDKKAPLLGIEEFAQTTEYMFEDKNDIPVIIGNIYENPELLKDGE